MGVEILSSETKLRRSREKMASLGITIHSNRNLIKNKLPRKPKMQSRMDNLETLAVCIDMIA